MAVMAFSEVLEQQTAYLEERGWLKERQPVERKLPRLASLEELVKLAGTP